MFTRKTLWGPRLVSPQVPARPPMPPARHADEYAALAIEKLRKAEQYQTMIAAREEQALEAARAHVAAYKGTARWQHPRVVAARDLDLDFWYKRNCAIRDACQKEALLYSSIAQLPLGLLSPGWTDRISSGRGKPSQG